MTASVLLTLLEREIPMRGSHGLSSVHSPDVNDASAGLHLGAPRVQCGLLKSYSSKDGYGFVQCEELFAIYGSDVYVHGAELPDGACCGSELKFCLWLSKKNQPQARRVTLADTCSSDATAAFELLPWNFHFEDCETAAPFPASHWDVARVVSWNLLAPCYATCKAFPDAEPLSLRWPRRAAQIRQVLTRLDADILCLQEVEIDRPLQELLPLFVEGAENERHCYKTVSCKRPSERSDGCVVAFKASRFNVLQEQRLSFDDYVPPGDEYAAYRRGSVAIVLVLHPLGAPPGWTLIIATTHLAWAPDNEAVRLWQVAVLLGEVQRFRSDRVVICGDFNSCPGGEVHRTLSSAFLSTYGDIETSRATSTNATADGGNGFAEMIDYCWLLRGGVRLSRRLCLPTLDELRLWLGSDSALGPVPTLVASGRWPSDHLPVAAEVILRP